jgi:DNA-binding MarR family transcriptional regulator
MTPNETAEPTGRYAYDGLDRVFHEKARLGIMTSLFIHPDGLLFRDLKELCSLTDGNLSRHVQVLNEAGLVEVWKGFRDRRPQTLCRLSADGRLRFEEYMRELEKVLQDFTKVAAETAEKPKALEALPPGWAPAS